MRTLPRSRSIAAAIVTPLLMLGLTACGGDDTVPAASEVTSSEPTAESSDEPTEEPTETPSAEVEGEAVKNPDKLFVDMQEAMLKAGSARVAMDLGMGTAEGRLSYAGDDPEMALTMDLGQQGMSGMEMRYVDGVMYMAMPGLTPDGKFFRFDEDSKSLGPVLDQLKSLAPDASVNLMRKSVRKMTRLGEEDIEGEKTTHYLLVIDTAEALKLAEDTVPQGDAAALPETMEYDLWVTDDNLVRRFVMNVMSMSMQMDYTEWGKPVDVKAPDASDVIKAPAGM